MVVRASHNFCVSSESVQLPRFTNHKAVQVAMATLIWASCLYAGPFEGCDLQLRTFTALLCLRCDRSGFNDEPHLQRLEERREPVDFPPCDSAGPKLVCLGACSGRRRTSAAQRGTTAARFHSSVR